jgi:hypothetical protein
MNESNQVYPRRTLQEELLYRILTVFLLLSLPYFLEGLVEAILEAVNRFDLNPQEENEENQVIVR